MDQIEETEEVYPHQQYQGWWMKAQECIGIKRKYIIVIHTSKHKKISKEQGKRIYGKTVK